MHRRQRCRRKGVSRMLANLEVLMNRRNFVMLAGTLAVVAVLSLAASAQTSIQFALPSDVSLIIGSSGSIDGDVIVITGRTSGTTSAVGCAVPGPNYPIQSGVIVDPGNGGRASR